MHKERYNCAGLVHCAKEDVVFMPGTNWDAGRVSRPEAC